MAVTALDVAETLAHVKIALESARSTAFTYSRCHFQSQFIQVDDDSLLDVNHVVPV